MSGGRTVESERWSKNSPQLTADKNKIKIGIQNSKVKGPDKNNCEGLSISGSAGVMLFIQACVFVCEYVCQYGSPTSCVPVTAHTCLTRCFHPGPYGTQALSLAPTLNFDTVIIERLPVWHRLCPCSPHLCLPSVWCVFVDLKSDSSQAYYMLLWGQHIDLPKSLFFSLTFM